jgi:transposase
LYKNTIGSKVRSNIQIKADSGYQGILKFHQNSLIPVKKSKKNPLTLEDKAFNRKLSGERILVENINAKIKVFRCMSSRYRNRRKRHGLRMSLICGILNFELSA